MEGQYLTGFDTEPVTDFETTYESRSETVAKLDADHPSFRGSVARVRIDAYGPSAGDVEWRLLDAASKIDSAIQSFETEYGQCVVERNLEEEWGAAYSWRGRLTIKPCLGREPFVPVTRLQDALET